MADQKPCSINAPHEAHPWQDSHPYNGFVPQMVPSYHLCSGKQWNNKEVYNNLQALIRDALSQPRYIRSGEPSQDEQIMLELWPQVVGFLQPEDMPHTVNLGPALNPEDPQTWGIQPGRIMQLPQDPMTRIADALEKIQQNTQIMVKRTDPNRG